MFEITRDHADVLEKYICNGIAYKDGVYDFTFENRFLIYHTQRHNRIAYIAVDTYTGLSSEICQQQKLYGEEDYEALIPQIFNAIKYTGDTRYMERFGQKPLETIDSIFRVILPRYGYSVREEQIALSKNMYIALTTRKMGICEAEVGTGKTMAYLVAALCARKSQATQYNWNEPLTSVLRKGREHYFWPARHRDYVSVIGQYPQKYQATLNLLLKNKFAQKTFDLDKAKIPAGLKDRVCVKETCGDCKHTNCKYRSYVRDAMNMKVRMDFQITNHNLYIMSNRKDNLLRPSSLVIVDEGHKFKDAAQDIFGESLREQDIPRYLKWMRNKYGDKRNRSKFRAMLEDAYALNSRLFLALRETYQLQQENEENGTLTLDKDTKSLIIRMEKQIERIESAREMDHSRHEVSGQRICEALRQIARSEKNIIWLDEDDQELVLKSTPKDVGQQMARTIWQGSANHVLTSGTMSDGTDFSFFKQENGLNCFTDPLEVTTRSPFDYANHTRLYIPKDLPFPSDENPKYLPAVADRIVELIHATNGHTAILFTSYKLLQMIHAMTRERLKDYEVIYMTKKNKTAIEDFKKSRNGVLFASGSMWEGVDCPGDSLSSVIIVRLPFPQRSAVMEEKKDQYENIGEFVRQIAVPEMLIKLRQGAGRLIRTETDTGVLSVLDARANTGSYAGRIEQALCKYPRVETLEEVAEFMRQVKPAEYFEKGNDHAD